MPSAFSNFLKKTKSMAESTGIPSFVRHSGIASNTYPKMQNTFSAIAGRTAGLSFSAVAGLAKRPGLVTGSMALGASAYAIGNASSSPISRSSSNFMDSRPFSTDQVDIQRINSSFTDNRSFQNSAAGLTFGLHKRRHR